MSLKISSSFILCVYVILEYFFFLKRLLELTLKPSGPGKETNMLIKILFTLSYFVASHEDE